MRGAVVGGTIRTSNESSEVLWMPVNELEGLNIHPSMRLRIDHALDKDAVPYLG